VAVDQGNTCNTDLKKTSDRVSQSKQEVGVTLIRPTQPLQLEGLSQKIKAQTAENIRIRKETEEANRRVEANQKEMQKANKENSELQEDIRQKMAQVVESVCLTWNYS
jgi:predicted nuclease with TOPRIM domain